MTLHRSTLRRRGRPALLLGLLTLATLGLAAPTSAADPDLVSGRRDAAPLKLHGAIGEIARLDVGPGRWVAWATLSMSTERGGLVGTRCTFGPDGSTIRDQHTGRASRYYDVLQEGLFTSDLDLGAVGRFEGDEGAFVLRCTASKTQVEATRIRIAALRVQDLVRIQLPDAKPPAITRDVDAIQIRRPSAVELPLRVWTHVASVELPDGPWWLHASATTFTEAGTSAYPYCRLRMASLETRAGAVVVAEGWQMHPLDLAVVSTRAPRGSRIARLECYRDQEATGSVIVRDALITAVNVGWLRRDHAPSGGQSLVGAGDPAAIHSTDAEDATISPNAVQRLTDVVSVPVPAGRWLVKATFMAHSVADENGDKGGGRLVCSLGTGTGRDRVVVSTPAPHPPVSMTRIHAGNSDGQLVLSCARPETTKGLVEIRHLQVTLLKVGDLTTDPL